MLNLKSLPLDKSRDNTLTTNRSRPRNRSGHTHHGTCRKIPARTRSAARKARRTAQPSSDKPRPFSIATVFSFVLIRFPLVKTEISKTTAHDQDAGLLKTSESFSARTAKADSSRQKAAPISRTCWLATRPTMRSAGAGNFSSCASFATLVQRTCCWGDVALETMTQGSSDGRPASDKRSDTSA
jgi:hypothetical protein